MATAEVTNLGAIEYLNIPIRKGGGVTVLRGPNGSGKSTAIAAIQEVATGGQKLPVRDGKLSGAINGFGVTITLGKSKRRKGELEATIIDGKYSLADLISPSFQTPEARDNHRTKTLAQLAQVAADASLFYELVGGQEYFEQAVGPLNTDDLLVMAGKVKRALQSRARHVESLADNSDGHVQACLAAAQAFDATIEHNPDVLQAALETAISTEATLRQKAVQAELAKSDAEQAGASLQQAKSEYSGNSTDGALLKVDRIKKLVAERTIAIQQAEQVLRDARTSLAGAQESLASAEAELTTAQAHDRMVAQWEAQIEASRDVHLVPVESLTAAVDAVKTARAAVELGVVIRQAKAQKDAAVTWQTQAATHRKEAERLRAAADGTDDVLTSVVSRLGCPLRVKVEEKGPRLVTDTARGETYFDELSDGERSLMALSIWIDLVGHDGLIPLDQQYWEGLQPANRDVVAKHAMDLGANVVTAQADDGPLRAEVYGE